MKKRMQIHLEQMAGLLPELDARNQSRILGGTAVSIGSPDDAVMYPVPTVVPCVSVECVPAMTSVASAPVLTSAVETSAVPTATTSMPTTSVSTSEMTPPISTLDVLPESTTPVYHWEDMERMQNSGSWYGGMVDGVGYVGEQTTVFSPSNHGVGRYCTYLEYMRSIETNYGEHIGHASVGVLPIAGDALEFIRGAISNVLQKLSGDLLEAGYGADSWIYTDTYQNSSDEVVEYRVWDARTGDMISSRTMNAVAYYKK